MYAFLIVVHIFVCFVLIAVILLQAGRGGGMSDMVGAGQPQSIFGTQTNAFMTRATEVCAVLFIVTSLVLGIYTTQRGKSLIEKQKIADAIKTTVPTLPQAGETTKETTPVPSTAENEAAPSTTNAAPKAPSA